MDDQVHGVAKISIQRLLNPLFDARIEQWRLAGLKLELYAVPSEVDQAAMTQERTSRTLYFELFE